MESQYSRMEIVKRLTIDVIVVCLFLVVCVSCAGGGGDVRLAEAERMMDEHPDSAILILDSIRPSSLRSSSDRALYGLLYTQAMDKNYLSPSSDSLIASSVKYYESGEDNLKKALSNYYHGRVLYHSGNFSKAIVSYYKAKDVAESNGYDFWAGMACRGISDIYNETYNAAEELTFAQQEYDFIKRSGKQPYLNYALQDLGRALVNNGESGRAISIAGQLVDSAMKSEDPYLYTAALQLKASGLISQERYADAYPLLCEICGGEYAGVTDSLYLCLALVENKSVGEAAKLMEKMSDENLPLKSMVRYKMHKLSGRYEKALVESEYIGSVTDSMFKTSVSHSLAGSLGDYFELNRRLDESQIKESRFAMWLTVTVAVAVLIVMGSAAVMLYRRQKREIESKVIFAEQLQESLDSSMAENADAAAVIKKLLSAKNNLLEELSGIVMTNADTRVARRKIADAVTKLIDDLSIRSEKIKELEDYVDSLYGNLFSNFKSDLPGLKEVDYRLYLFSVLGLSIPTITLFLKEGKVDAVYNRKRRLKDKIRQLGEEKGDRYLSYMR